MIAKGNLFFSSRRQTSKESLAYSGLEIFFAFTCFRSARKCLSENEFERSVGLCGWIVSVIVLMNTPLQVRSKSDVNIITRDATDCVYDKHTRVFCTEGGTCQSRGVASAGRLEPSCLAT